MGQVITVIFDVCLHQERIVVHDIWKVCLLGMLVGSDPEVYGMLSGLLNSKLICLNDTVSEGLLIGLKRLLIVYRE